MQKKLTTSNHDRDSAGLTYVYPVISRRAGGLSVGINLNPNNACNWRCIYCQVPDLRRGAAPEIDRGKLEMELRGFLQSVVAGSFFQDYQVEPEFRVIRDIAISGNGEPTSARGFDAIVQLIGEVAGEFELLGKINIVLISNGSLMQRTEVQRGISLLEGLHGETWFKLDSATNPGRNRINDGGHNVARARLNLMTAAGLCPTWVQTCLFALDGQPPPASEFDAYMDFLRGLLADDISLRGVLLYGLARPSLQPEAPRLSRLDQGIIEKYAKSLREMGFEVRVSF